jgi:hypothetical protein
MFHFVLHRCVDVGESVGLLSHAATDVLKVTLLGEHTDLKLVTRFGAPALFACGKSGSIGESAAGEQERTVVVTISLSWTSREPEP